MLRVLEPPPPGVLVQPVLLDYGAVAEEVGWVGVETRRGQCQAAVVAARIVPDEGAFPGPLYPQDFPGRKAIAAESRRRIEEALVASLGHPLRPFAYAVDAVRYEAPAEQPVETPSSDGG